MVESEAQTLTAGAPSSPLSVQLLDGAGMPLSAPSDTTVTLSSSSPQGTFAASAAGPWSSTLSVTVPTGSSATPGFYYEDTRAGTPLLTASSGGSTDATQTETVDPGPLASIAVAPTSATVASRSTQVFNANGADAYGNPLAVPDAAWSVAPNSLGTVSPPTGSSTTFTAGARAGDGTVTASLDGIQGSVAVQTLAPPPTPPNRKPCIVPKAKRTSLKLAKRSIRAHACSVGKIKRSASRTVKKGHVIAQEPKAGRRLKHGARINLVVSSGRPRGA